MNQERHGRLGWALAAGALALTGLALAAGWMLVKQYEETPIPTRRREDEEGSTPAPEPVLEASPPRAGAVEAATPAQAEAFARAATPEGAAATPEVAAPPPEVDAPPEPLPKPGEPGVLPTSSEPELSAPATTRLPEGLAEASKATLEARPERFLPDLALEPAAAAFPDTPPAAPITLEAGSPPWLRAAAATHVGKVRAANEDRFLLAPWGSEEAVLAVVADGMGGHGGGDLAAQIAVQGLRRHLDGPLPASDAERYEDLCRGLDDIEHAIHRRGRMEHGRANMGATIVVALFTPQGTLHLHAGDSRLYHYRDGERLYQTKDHSIVQVLLTHGRLTPEEAAVHPLRNQVTSCLGGSTGPGNLIVDPAWADTDGEQPSVLGLQPGDVVLLCSDGLCGEIRSQALDDLVRHHGEDPTMLVTACIEAALAAGGRDNVTVVAARFGEGG